MMQTTWRNLLRRAAPRSVRNWLRSPRKTLAWIGNEIRGPIPYPVRLDWTLRCPRNAAESAFHLQRDDPPQVREFDDFLELIRRLPRVILLDIGSHFGLFSFAAVHYGAAGSRALAVDPSAEARRMVRRVAELNGWTDRVTFIQAAVGARIGVLEMVETGFTAAGYVVLPGDHPASDRVRIPLTTVDRLVADMPEPPTVIKVDVESYELEVLEGGQTTFSQSAIPLCLELHNQMLRERGADPSQVLEKLRAFGYLRYWQSGHEAPPSELLQPDIARFIASKSEE